MTAIPATIPDPARTDLLARIGGAWLDPLVLLFATYAWFATPLLTLRLVTDWSEAARLLASGIFTAMAALAALWLARRLPAWLAAVRPRLADAPLWSLVALGVLLRLGWMFVFPAEPGSDGAIYVELARRLTGGGAYEISGTHAYWPAGYPLFLAAWMTVFGAGKVAWLLSNLVLFAVAAIGVAHLATQLAGPLAGRLAALLFALWPNLIAGAATPEKEAVVIALLPWVCVIVVDALRQRRHTWRVALGGALLGGCVLVQPSLQLLVPAFAALLAAAARPTRRGLMLAALLCVGAAAAIAPWTLRNYETFGRFVLVSTNGGDNLYRANNPLATGGYTPRGEVDISDLDEIERDTQGKRLAVAWIANHPAAFLTLALEKQFRFMGDDAAGVYGTFKVGKASDSGIAYALLKAFANAWWLAMWVLLAAAVLALRGSDRRLPPMCRLPLWLWLYLFALHSVFESAGKYHMPVLWALPVLIACYALASTRVERR